MGAHEPFRQEWTVLALDFEGKLEEVPHSGTSAPRSATMTGPRRAPGDVYVVIAGNLLAHRNIAACHKERAVDFVEHIRIGVTAVIDVSIRRTQ